MELTFFGAADTVTGSCYLFNVAGHKFLVDCGLFQGPKAIKERNYGEFPFNPREIEFILLTHAHIDHSGLIPKLVKKGFKGTIYATEPTVDLAAVMLPDSGHVQEMEVERKNRKLRRAGKPELQPIYTADDAFNALAYFQKIPLETPITPLPGLEVTFFDAGHILGSAMIKIAYKGQDATRTILFTGDLGRNGRPFMKEPQKVPLTDILVLESTYGDRVRSEEGDLKTLLKSLIEKVYRRNGNLIIPAFAMERTQDLIYILNDLVENKEVPPIDVYIDSPLAVEITKLFKKYPMFFNEEYKEKLNRGDDPLAFPGLHFSVSQEDSVKLNNISRAIIISASGMADAGRIRHHLKHNLWRPESAVLLVGYQAQDTLGRKLLDGAKEVKIMGEEIAVKAEVYHYDGLSAHADQRELLAFIGRFSQKPAQIYLVHGEDEARLNLKKLIEEKYRIPCYLPRYQETISLLANLPGKSEEVLIDKVITLLKAKQLTEKARDLVEKLVKELES
ncbi:MBL fold metallo-hydrolase RNA specificity domain-containing protein [Carboxydothermus hydrogenoformans]|uniref:Metallo-beta-lactamase family protein n=1 Tax=Carboxydothermus hydrogenoformans (strain ATCC BAA-161 / DSM 6008 / Z-2901) TaxID=246194 RepID=Q3AAG6_CARHZ|nr:MBL fold metallo-hydrolase [Carboxydothermus hydrogenoformans]ABB14158.1 metallo-beta-lactamase family protein [Carboxydothermus hydrogenoformans Z-2901]